MNRRFVPETEHYGASPDDDTCNASNRGPVYRHRASRGLSPLRHASSWRMRRVAHESERLLSGTWFDVRLVGGWFEKLANALPFARSVEAGRAVLAGDYAASFSIWGMKQCVSVGR